MKVPFNGKVSAKLIEKRFKGQVFYCVRDLQADKGYEIESGFLVLSGNINTPMIRPIKDNVVKNFARGCSWSMIFETLDDAKKKKREIDKIFLDGFSFKPLIRVNVLIEIKDQLLEIESVINLIFSNHSDFKGVRFSDVSAGGIQVYAAGFHATLHYDLSNKVSVIKFFLSELNNL